MTESCKAIINFLGCDYELFENEKSADKITDRWNELTEQGERKGFFPLLIVVSDVLSDALEIQDMENTPEGVAAFRENVLHEAEEVDVRTFLDERLAEYMEMHSDMDIMGKFKSTSTEPTERFCCHLNILKKNRPHPEILIAKVPAKHPWELAAWLPMGGFNDCPSPTEQTAVFKYWYEKYGAVPGVVTYDNWEMKLTRPPLKDEEAEALAKEHFAFCYDVVMQASEGWATIRARASELKGSTVWYFWWD
ncbi:MAG: DUF4253 domain-containing protein [Synergistaceae bacterium]|nr:DUF4253 domain-containing protein [Synergistaceae bacterium]